MESIPALPGDRCRVNPHPSWTLQEKWAWTQICSGTSANFTEAKGYGGRLDPKNPEAWPEKRIITPAFLETILLYEPYRGSIPRMGVQIIGAWFKEKIDLSNATLSHSLLLMDSRFESDIYFLLLKTPYFISLSGSKFNGTLHMDSLQVGEHLIMNESEFSDASLIGAKVGYQLSMINSKFSRTLNMNGIHVDGNLFMNRKAEFSDVILTGAKVGINLEMDGSKFSSTLDMNGIHVNGNLFMRYGAEFSDVILTGVKVGNQLSMTSSKFNRTLDMNGIQVSEHLIMNGITGFSEVILRGAKVGNNLEMDGSKFSSTLDMNGIHVDGNLFMRNKSEFSEVFLINAKVGLNVDMSSSKFSGKLIMESSQVDGNLFLHNKAEFKKPLSIVLSRLNMNLIIFGSSFSSLDLTGTKIEKEFMLRSEKYPSAKWKEGSKLTLRNTEIGALQYREDAWDNLELELTGFTYSHLGGYASGETHPMAVRDTKWLTEEWLKRHKKYSPQPYEQLAKVLNEDGYKEKAKDVLFACKERERKEAKGLNKFFLTLLKFSVGYGYRNIYASYWIILFTFIGFLVIQAPESFGKIHDTNNLLNNWLDRVIYSFDILLPIVKLNELHYKMELTCFIKYYFYFQRLIGYFLGSVLIAGLSGITKK